MTDGGNDRRRKRQTKEKTDKPAEDMKHPQKDKGWGGIGVGGGWKQVRGWPVGDQAG
jgi:hypothetical protein